MSERPRGICSVCGADRALRLSGVLGRHRRVINKHYRGQLCPGTDQPPVETPCVTSPAQGPP